MFCFNNCEHPVNDVTVQNLIPDSLKIERTQQYKQIKHKRAAIKTPLRKHGNYIVDVM